MTVFGNNAKASPKRPGKQRRSHEERRAETTSRLLNGALELLLESGYSGFRIADAAKRAGVSRGGQTYHFATKMDLIETAIETEFGKEVDANRSKASNTVKTDILHRGAEHIDAFLTGKLFKACLNLLISVKPPNALVDKVKSISIKSREPIESAWIDRLIDAGADPETAKEAFWLLWNVQRGMAVQKHIGDDPDGGGGDILDFTVGLLNGYVNQRSLALSRGDKRS